MLMPFVIYTVLGGFSLVVMLRLVLATAATAEDDCSVFRPHHGFVLQQKQKARLGISLFANSKVKDKS